MRRFLIGLAVGPILAAVTWHVTHHTLVTWIIGVTTALLVWFGAPIIRTAADVAEDLID